MGCAYDRPDGVFPCRSISLTWMLAFLRCVMNPYPLFTRGPSVKGFLSISNRSSSFLLSTNRPPTYITLSCWAETGSRRGTVSTSPFCPSALTKSFLSESIPFPGCVHLSARRCCLTDILWSEFEDFLQALYYTLSVAVVLNNVMLFRRADVSPWLGLACS
jgi:hypothetical protein